MNDSLAAVLELAKSNGKIIAFVATIAVLLSRAFTQKSPLVRDLHRVGLVEGKQKASEDSNDSDYDIIIVGGGTAGCVLASRLSEDPSISVLMLESGDSGLSVMETQIPAAWTMLLGAKGTVWGDYTVPQEGLLGKIKYSPQGRMLGGSSSMNALIFHRGAAEEYDEWAAKNSDPGSELWAFKNFSKYFAKMEKYVPSTKFPLVDSTLRGSSGPVEVGHFSYVHEVTTRFIDACLNIGINRVQDVNTHLGPLGVTSLMTYIGPKGRRVSAETAYLTPSVLSRPNLKVAVNAHVTRILFEQMNGTTKAVGVEFANTEQGPRFRANARKEVVVSAGTIHTPHVLMLSGVGDSKHLKSHSIEVVKDLPGVGDHLVDHLMVDGLFRDKTKSVLLPVGLTLSDKLYNFFLTIRWIIAGTGPLSSNMAEAACFVRSNDPKIFAGDTSPAPEPSAGPDIELLFSPGGHIEHGFGPRPVGHLWSMHEVLLKPTSTGSITLKSADPFTGPVIDPRYLSNENDLKVLVRGLKFLLKVARTQPLSEAIDETETSPVLHTQTHTLDDDQLVDVVRSQAETIYHPCCTARMAPLKDEV